MKKQEKWTPHIIAAAAFVVFVVLGLACATTPQEGTSTYLITRNPPAKETGYLNGKKAVIFNIGMADRGSAVANTKNNGNYLDIFQAVGNVARIARAVSFNSTAKKFDKENEDDLKVILSIFDGIIASAWQRAYEAETVQVAFNFGNTTPRLNHFDRPNAALKSEIARICAENDAEYAVSIIQQIDHGYLDEGYLVGTRKMAAITFIVARINVFDKNGNIVLSATAKFPSVTSSVEYGLIISPNDGEQYAQLYLNSFGNILATIMAFDTSAAVSTDELLEGVVVQLATTEEVEEDK
jgi:hypothetical protein